MPDGRRARTEFVLRSATTMFHSRQSMPEFVGVLPAAGLGSRLQPYRQAKELLPVAYVVDEDSREARPTPVVGLSLSALAAAGIRRCLVVTSPWKPELLRCLGDGSDYAMRLAYVQQASPAGLAQAIDCAYPWTRDAYTCMSLPDTLVSPSSAMARLVGRVAQDGLDLALGVFPTSIPEELGPVRFGEDGRVYEVLDKPKNTELRNTWGMAVWSPVFGELLHESVERDEHGLVLGDVFDLAVKRGLKTRAVWFETGSFIDVGTTKGLFMLAEQASLMSVAPYSRAAG
jgi:glucose-1-phosphate thymidylyltransferase